MAKYASRRTEYNPERDEMLWQRTGILKEGWLVLVQIYRYDMGVPKVQVAKHDVQKNLHVKLNRLTKEELAIALPLLHEAQGVLENKEFTPNKTLWNENDGDGE